MLRILDDWLIPPATKNAMSGGDCLMITLAVYFHDLGMIVTKDEYELREKSSFPGWKSKTLNGIDDQSKILLDKLSRLDSDEVERFLYTEFVRENHARRIMAWIRGDHAPQYGIAQAAALVVSETLVHRRIR